MRLLEMSAVYGLFYYGRLIHGSTVAHQMLDTVINGDEPRRKTTDAAESHEGQA